MMEFKESPNQSKRTGSKINMIVIHATAGETFEGALKWMLNPKAKVSSHYLIGKDGKAVQLVQDFESAWHAGKSVWRGEENCNNFSIGIELVNKNDGKDTYPDIQIIRTSDLIRNLQKNFNIPLERIVGHFQIAPGRKSDPGILFPWVRLGALL